MGRICTICSSTNYYAKGLCHKCYDKNRGPLYYQNNKDRMNQNNKQYRESHKDQFQQQTKAYRARRRQHIREKNKRWQSENKEHVLAYNRTAHSRRVQTDTIYRIKRGLRDRLNKAIKKNWKSGSAVKDLGCTIPDFKQYLESQFYANMTWDNWGAGPGKWQIHHIIPLHTVDLTKREDFLRVNHYTNLKPLWSEDHISEHTTSECGQHPA